MDELVLVPGLHSSRTVLSDGGHKAKDVNGGVSLQDSLQTNINGNQHTRAANASTAVDHSRTSGVRHLDLHEEVGDCLCALRHSTDRPGGEVEVAHRAGLNSLYKGGYVNNYWNWILLQMVTLSCTHIRT